MYMIPYTRRSNSSMMDLFDELERSMFGESGRRTPVFSTDIRDEGAHYLLQADLPGFQKDEISVELQNGYLTIQAAKGLDRDQKDQEGRYIRQERCTGSCARSFYVGKELEPKDISAKFENGILSLHLPKADAKKLEPKQTLIEIE